MSELPHPSAFNLKRIPAPFPPALQDALDASGNFRYTGAHWDWQTRQAMLFSGYYDIAGDTLGWKLYIRHPACRGVLRDYDFGKGAQPPGHWLVFDWKERQVWVGTSA